MKEKCVEFIVVSIEKLGNRCEKNTSFVLWNLQNHRICANFAVLFHRKHVQELLGWWNGRHEGLKILWPLRLCGFKSHSEYKQRPATYWLRGVVIGKGSLFA